MTRWETHTASPRRRLVGPSLRERSPFPDFYIGAHAAVRAITLLMRAAARYRSYFPTLSLIAPRPIR